MIENHEIKISEICIKYIVYICKQIDFHVLHSENMILIVPFLSVFCFDLGVGGFGQTRHIDLHPHLCCHLRDSNFQMKKKVKGICFKVYF